MINLRREIPKCKNIEKIDVLMSVNINDYNLSFDNYIEHYSYDYKYILSAKYKYNDLVNDIFYTLVQNVSIDRLSTLTQFDIKEMLIRDMMMYIKQNNIKRKCYEIKLDK